jgi:hypothetical protein
VQNTYFQTIYRWSGNTQAMNKAIPVPFEILTLIPAATIDDDESVPKVLNRVGSIVIL